MSGRRRRASTRCSTPRRWASATPRSGGGRTEMSRRPPPSPGRDAREPSPRPRTESGARDEVRLYGLNAVNAVFARRPQAIRKLYLSSERIPALQSLLKWCVANRVGYRVVEDVEEP